MKSLRFLAAAAVIASVTAGCASMQTAEKPVSSLKGDNVVCIFWHDSTFNITLKDKISDYVVGKGFKTVSDEEYRAGAYKGSDYGAVVFLAKYEAKGSLTIVDTFVDKYGKKTPVIVALSHEWTVDGADVRRHYDALTAASKEFEQDEILAKITSRLDGVFGW